jgi:hypothetical protein
VLPVIVSRFIIIKAKFSSTTGPFKKAICTKRPSLAKTLILRGI